MSDKMRCSHHDAGGPSGARKRQWCAADTGTRSCRNIRIARGMGRLCAAKAMVCRFSNRMQGVRGKIRYLIIRTVFRIRSISRELKGARRFFRIGGDDMSRDRLLLLGGFVGGVLAALLGGL